MNKENLAIPFAIIVAAALIAGAIYLKDDAGSLAEKGNVPEEMEDVEIRPVDNSDHIRGNPNAPILLVEYSDYDCPFCQVYHETMRRILDEYGTSGKVAWVYRHFPLESLHPNAKKLAEAAECVAELGGNDAFWKFSDQVFEEKPQNDMTDIKRLPEFAANAGVDQNAFVTCFQSGRHADKINDSIDEAVRAGGTGTPHTIVIVGDDHGVISGAQPYEAVKEIVDNLIAQMEGRAAGNPADTLPTE